MATRSTAHFTSGETTRAIIYRHWDGYPEGAGADIFEFLDKVKENSPGDTRFTDPEYLAARYVWFLGEKFTHRWDAETDSYVRGPDLAFTSVGVCMADPGDIEYRYIIKCDFGHDPTGQITDGPFVFVQSGFGDNWSDPRPLTRIECGLEVSV